MIYNIKYSIYKTEYSKKALNKPFTKVYHMEFPIRIRGFPFDIRDFGTNQPLSFGLLWLRHQCLLRTPGCPCCWRDVAAKWWVSNLDTH